MALMTEAEQELAAAARQGDRAALDELIGRLYRPVCALALRLLGRTEDPREVAQETFARVARHIQEFDPARSFSAWVFTIAANLCRTRIRRAPGSKAFELAEASGLEVDVPPEGKVLHLEDHERAHRALDELPFDLKVVVLMHFQQDLPLGEIARTLGVSRNAVGIRLYRALKFLRQRLKE